METQYLAHLVSRMSGGFGENERPRAPRSLKQLGGTKGARNLSRPSGVEAWCLERERAHLKHPLRQPHQMNISLLVSMYFSSFCL